MPDYENHYDKNDRYDDYNDVDDNVEDHDSQQISSADHQCGPHTPCRIMKINMLKDVDYNDDDYHDNHIFFFS